MAFFDGGMLVDTRETTLFCVSRSGSAAVVDVVVDAVVVIVVVSFLGRYMSYAILRTHDGNNDKKETK